MANYGNGSSVVSRKAKASSVLIEDHDRQHLYPTDDSAINCRHKRNHNSLPVDLTYSFDETLLTSIEGDAPLSPMSRIVAFRKELELLKGCVSDRTSMFSAAPSNSPDLSMLDFSPPSDPAPLSPLPIDEPFKILSTSSHIVLPMEEYSVQVPMVTTTDEATPPSPSINQISVSEKIDKEFSLSELDLFSADEGGVDEDGRGSPSGGCVPFTRQKSLEYDHLEPGSEDDLTKDGRKKSVNNNYTVTVQFHEVKRQDDVDDEEVPNHQRTFSLQSLMNEKSHCPACCSCSSSYRQLFDNDYRERKLSHQLHSNQHQCDETLSNASWPTCHIERYSSTNNKKPTYLTPPMVAVSQRTSKRLDNSSKDKQFGSSVEISHSNSVIEDELEISGSCCNNVRYDTDNQSIFSLMSYQSALTCHSNCSFNHHPFAKGVEGSTFKDRVELICQWYKEFNDYQRNSMILQLLSLSNCSQMHMLSLEMEPVLHQTCPHNCQDLLSWLPSSIVFHIMSFLDPVSLCRASQVSKLWYTIANDRLLWKRLTYSRNWQLSSEGHAKQMKMFSSKGGDVQWKLMFTERFRLRRNWLKGYCTVRTFEGHSQGISCVQFDDTRIVSGSWDKTIKVWNRRTNTAWAALTLAGHSGTVRCLHLHGNRLVSGSSDRTIKVWDLATNNLNWVGAACKATMVGHLHTVRCLKADDSKVVSGSYDHTLKIWDIKTGTCSRTLRGHTDAVLCLQFDSEKVISGSKDTTIKVWEFSNGLCKLTLHGHEGAVSCLQFDDDRIISGALDRLIKIWNLSTGQCVRTIDWIKSEGHTGVVRHLQADSWKLVSAADDKTLKVWSIQSGERLLTLRSHSDGVTCLQFNDQVIVSGSYDKTVKLWDFSVC